jgi:hypothetical protein
MKLTNNMIERLHMSVLENYLWFVLKLIAVPLFMCYVLRQVSRIMQRVISDGHGFDLIFLAPGTIVHELAHFTFMKIFSLFTLRFARVRLFSPEQEEDGSTTLGYVEPLYSRWNLLHQVGLFFGGMAPVFVIGGLLSYSYAKFFPASTQTILNVIAVNKRNMPQTILSIFRILLHPVAPFSWQSTILFLIILILIGSGFTLSNSDFITTLEGLPAILILLFVASYFHLFSQETASELLNGFLIVMIVFTIVMAVLGSIMLLIKSIFT